MAGDGADAQPITVSVVDAQGREVPTANLPVTFELTGPGVIIGHGNGDNCSHEPEKSNHRSLFNGLAQVIVQAARGGSNALGLRAYSAGLKTADVSIAVKSVPPIPSVCP